MPPPPIAAAIKKVAAYGRVTLRRAYGNWAKECLRKWPDYCRELAVRPMEQVDYVAHKNASDMALVIDAVELCGEGIYDGFAIMSSDSDFTPLAIRLREKGKYVIGIGESKTPQSFVKACDEFIRIEHIDSTPLSPAAACKPSGPKNQNRASQAQADSASESPDEGQNALHQMIKQAHDELQDENGYVHLSAAGIYLRRIQPDFSPGNYRSSTLKKLLMSFPDRYEVLGEGAGAAYFRVRV
ncbi:MAG: NYN domain-containing protein [Coriobacteriia bacterium]|nr:NYN domain-containing protein [Coriobacteriia bacterium]